MRNGHHPVVLSARQREVLDLLALGRSYAEIAERLAIGQSTVRQHASQGRIVLGRLMQTLEHWGRDAAGQQAAERLTGGVE